MTTSLRCVPPPLPVSAIYRHDSLPHEPTLTSSQSLTFAPAIRTRPSSSPDRLKATTVGAPESLRDHSTFGSRRLSARPLASGKVGNLLCEMSWQASGITEPSAAAAAVLAGGCLRLNHTTTAATATS